MQTEEKPEALREAPEKIIYPHTALTEEQLSQVTGGKGQETPEIRGMYYTTEEFGKCICNWCPDYNQIVGLVTDSTGVLRCYTFLQPACLQN